MAQIFEKSNNCRKYNLDEYRSHYGWRVGGSNIPFEDFLRSEQRKLHQGKFFNHDFFIRYINSDDSNNVTGINLNRDALYFVNAGWANVRLLCNEIMHKCGNQN